jgi:hypothetical protein
VQGTTGVQGIQGRQGVQGATGSQGTTGAQGATGSQGTTGTQGTLGTQGASGPSTTINASDDTSSTTLYPVMVAGTGSNQTARARSTATAFSFNASTNSLTSSTVRTDSILTTGGLQNRGRIIQVVNSSTTSSVQASNAVNVGGTNGAAPSSTSGTQYHSFSFTPLRSDSTIIMNSTNLAVSEAWNFSDVLWAAAFAGTSLIIASSCPVGYYAWGSYNSTFVNLCGSIASWGTSSRTISIRYGSGGYGSSGNNGYGIGINNDYYYNSQATGVNTVNFVMMEVAP